MKRRIRWIMPVLFAVFAFLPQLTQGAWVDSFNRTPSGEHRTPQGQWTTQGAQGRFAITTNLFFGPEGSSLELNYNVCGTNQEFGYWRALEVKDLARFSLLSFRIKGTTGGEHVRIRLEDQLWFDDRLLIEDILQAPISTNWQTVEVPLDRFSSLRDWHHIQNFSIIAQHEDGSPCQGTVYIDEFRLDGAPRNIPELTPEYPTPPASESLRDDELLSLVQKHAVMYFWNEVNPETGLVKDRCHTQFADGFRMGSIAAVGFGLPCLCLGIEQDWLERDAVYDRILTTLRFFKNTAQNKHGFFYHFLRMDNGKRYGECEISSIDTALFIAGALFAGEYFPGTEVQTLAREIYDRIDWAWMLNGGTSLSMGWTPEKGFIKHRWNHFDEHLLLDILAIGATSNAVPPATWKAFKRTPVSYGPYNFYGATPLFTHQYSQLFIDFRNIRDDSTNYFDNARLAALAQWQWAVDNPRKRKTYSAKSWGLTASDGPHGYKAYGAPHGPEDGTVAPTAAAASYPYTPAQSLAAMRYWYGELGPKLWGRYGFADAYNLDLDWVSRVHIGIDQGPIALMIANEQNDFVWQYFMKVPAVQRGLERCGFRPSVHIIETLDLQGTWHFRTGDELQWAQQKEAGDDWRDIPVPSNWEDQGLPNYDGIAWYWVSFDLPPHAQTRWQDKTILLDMGAIDDVDQTFINEQQVGFSGNFPPDYQTAWDQPRTYAIPFDLLNFDGPNYLAIRTFDATGTGGLWKGPVEIKVIEPNKKIRSDNAPADR